MNHNIHTEGDHWQPKSNLFLHLIPLLRCTLCFAGKIVSCSLTEAYITVDMTEQLSETTVPVAIISSQPHATVREDKLEIMEQGEVNELVQFRLPRGSY